MDQTKQIILVPPMTSAMKKIENVIGTLDQTEDKFEVSLIDDLKEIEQFISTMGSALIILGDPKKCANFLSNQKAIIAKNKCKVVLMTNKEVPSQTLDKFLKIGLTDALLESAQEKTIAHKIKVIIKSFRLSMAQESSANDEKMQLSSNNTLIEQKTDEKWKPEDKKDIKLDLLPADDKRSSLKTSSLKLDLTPAEDKNKKDSTKNPLDDYDLKKSKDFSGLIDPATSKKDEDLDSGKKDDSLKLKSHSLKLDLTSGNEDPATSSLEITPKDEEHKKKSSGLNLSPSNNSDQKKIDLTLDQGSNEQESGKGNPENNKGLKKINSSSLDLIKSDSAKKEKVPTQKTKKEHASNLLDLSRERKNVNVDIFEHGSLKENNTPLTFADIEETLGLHLVETHFFDSAIFHLTNLDNQDITALSLIKKMSQKLVTEFDVYTVFFKTDKTTNVLFNTFEDRLVQHEKINHYEDWTLIKNNQQVMKDYQEKNFPAWIGRKKATFEMTREEFDINESLLKESEQLRIEYFIPLYDQTKTMGFVVAYCYRPLSLHEALDVQNILELSRGLYLEVPKNTNGSEDETQTPKQKGLMQQIRSFFSFKKGA